jgi:hypothetical protein
MSGQIARTTRDPANKLSLRKRDGDPGSDRISIAACPLQFETDPGTTRLPCISQQNRRVIQSREDGVDAAVVVDISCRQAAGDKPLLKGTARGSFMSRNFPSPEFLKSSGGSR